MSARAPRRAEDPAPRDETERSGAGGRAPAPLRGHEMALRGPVRPGSGAMFDRIAARYDLLNRLMSLGIDRLWRRRTAAALALAPGARVLDLATGTGDLALEILRRQPGTRCVGVDPSPNMLAVAAHKSQRAGLSSRLTLEVGVAENLPFGKAEFDGTCIAFGIRNATDRLAALTEMARVTRTGGRIVILELGEPRRGLLGPLVRLHVHHVVPRLGAWLSGAREYRYLQESIAAFPPPEEFAGLMRRAGIDVLRIEPLSFGVCHLYVGQKPAEAARR
jgi:demethylmenaquinone methyltransferase/2-methoxy-6-polyprenyl-1,4-benzoquinol methylase